MLRLKIIAVALVLLFTINAALYSNDNVASNSEKSDNSAANVDRDAIAVKSKYC